MMQAFLNLKHAVSQLSINEWSTYLPTLQVGWIVEI